MRRLTFSIALLIAIVFDCHNSHAWISPFSKQDIERVGEDCVAGFYGNLGHTGTFHVGEVELLNRRFQDDFRKVHFPGNDFHSRKVVIHAGKGIAPSYSTSRENQRVDWTVNVWPSDIVQRRDTSHWSIQIDIYLGDNIDLDKLEIPKTYKVVSGGEIESFVAKHSQGKIKSVDPSEKREED